MEKKIIQVNQLIKYLGRLLTCVLGVYVCVCACVLYDQSVCAYTNHMSQKINNKKKMHCAQ